MLNCSHAILVSRFVIIFYLSYIIYAAIMIFVAIIINYNMFLQICSAFFFFLIWIEHVKYSQYKKSNNFIYECLSN